MLADRGEVSREVWRQQRHLVLLLEQVKRLLANGEPVHFGLRRAPEHACKCEARTKRDGAVRNTFGQRAAGFQQLKWRHGSSPCVAPARTASCARQICAVSARPSGATTGCRHQNRSPRRSEMPIADGSDSATLLDRTASLRQTNGPIVQTRLQWRPIM